MTAITEEKSVDNIPSKMHTVPLKREGFFTRNFPSDPQTTQVFVPVLGWVISLLCFHLVYKWFFWRSSPDFNDCIAIVAILTMISGAAYQLHWGLKIGDRKQYTPWIILKGIENLLMLICFITNIGYSIFFFPVAILLALNFRLHYNIIRKSLRESRTKMPETAQEDDKIAKELHQEGSIYSVV